MQLGFEACFNVSVSFLLLYFHMNEEYTHGAPLSFCSRGMSFPVCWALSIVLIGVVAYGEIRPSIFQSLLRSHLFCIPISAFLGCIPIVLYFQSVFAFWLDVLFFFSDWFLSASSFPAPSSFLLPPHVPFSSHPPPSSFFRPFSLTVILFFSRIASLPPSFISLFLLFIRFHSMLLSVWLFVVASLILLFLSSRFFSRCFPYVFDLLVVLVLLSDIPPFPLGLFLGRLFLHFLHFLSAVVFSFR